MSKVESDIVKIQEFLCLRNLEIPTYQRPYKWTAKNVIQLLQDVQAHKNKSTYRLGTVVINNDLGKVQIVDGQQRTLTLLLIAKAVLDRNKLSKFEHNGLTEILNRFKLELFDPKFSDEISIDNIRINYQEIKRFIDRMTSEEIYFLFSECEFVIFKLNDISEAFQFFDSQNARGKDLEPHDLLKAYHLREFSIEEEKNQELIVNEWESMESEEISSLFAEYLYRIKGWSKGDSSRFFTKNEIHLFKGINLSKIKNFPFAEIMRIAHFYVDNYNNNFERDIDLRKAQFPFQLDQTVINGKRFFELVAHYKFMIEGFKIQTKELDNSAKGILKSIDKYDGRWRTGDKYIHNLFSCAIIYYVDKFGYVELSRIVEKVFVWAYTLRLRHKAVYLASVDNYVVKESNIFKFIEQSINPNEVISYTVPYFSGSVQSTKTNELEKQFTKLNYLTKANV